MHTESWSGNTKGRDYLEDVRVDRSTILKWTLKTYTGCVDWIHLAQNRDQRRALVNTVMVIRIP
jgi:hypothetical protein